MVGQIKRLMKLQCNYTTIYHLPLTKHFRLNLEIITRYRPPPLKKELIYSDYGF